MRGLADAAVGVREQGGEIGVGVFFKSFLKESGDLGPGFAQGGVLRSGDLDGAVLIDAPAAAEVADVDAAVVAEFDIAGTDSFN